MQTFSLLMILCASVPAFGQSITPKSGPKVLLVVAHPDDEYFSSATVYKITHQLGGTVDQVVLTDGRGGFRYSLPSQPLYGKKLTDQTEAATYLPQIRKGELAQSGEILGINQHFYFDYIDQKTLDVRETFEKWGGEDSVKAKLKQVLEAGNYDFVFTLLPTATNHGHHKAAGIVSLEVLNEMPAGKRPAILAAVARAEGDNQLAIQKDDPVDARAYQIFESNELTRVRDDVRFTFDRADTFGFQNKLSFQIIVNWVIAAHKSQGAFQTYYGMHRFEDFRLFNINSESAIANAKLLFERLAEPVNDTLFSPKQHSL